jgi:hypothetical protein
LAPKKEDGSAELKLATADKSSNANMECINKIARIITKNIKLLTSLGMSHIRKDQGEFRTGC